METVSYLQNLTEIKSKHSGTQINKFVEKLLGDHRSDRNVDDEKNCICLKCLEKIFTFDFMWVQVSIYLYLMKITIQLQIYIDFYIGVRARENTSSIVTINRNEFIEKFTC